MCDYVMVRYFFFVFISTSVIVKVYKKRTMFDSERGFVYKVLHNFMHYLL